MGEFTENKSPLRGGMTKFLHFFLDMGIRNIKLEISRIFRYGFSLDFLSKGYKHSRGGVQRPPPHTSMEKRVKLMKLHPLI